MQIGARTAAWAKSGGWKNPYVTNGLIAMWDGEWNAGGGVHDSASRCVDLSTRGNDMIFNGDHSVEEGDVFINPRNLANDSPDIGYGIAGTDILGEEVKYLEVCFQYVAKKNDWLGVFYGSGGGGSVFISGTNSYLGVKPNAAYSPVAFSIDGVRVAAHAGDKFSVGVALGDVNGTVNGIPAVLPRSIDLEKFYGSIYLARANQNSVPKHSSIRFYSARIYSQVPSQTEISANYAIDKARFNLPDAA